MFNQPLLQEEIDAAGIPNQGVHADGFVDYLPEATELQRQQGAAIVAAHDPEALSTRQAGIAQLTAFLDSRVDDLKYADYIYRLQKRLLDLWRDKPALTARTQEVIAALKANKDSDANHLAMYNVFLDVVQVEYGMTVTAGEVIFSGTTQQQAAQARTVIQCARQFCVEGVTMANMLILNQRL